MREKAAFFSPGQRVSWLATTALLATALVGVARAAGPDVRMESKIGGLPVGLVKEAFGNPDPAAREKLIGVLADRIARDSGARNQFLAANVADAATLLAPYPDSDEVLSEVMNRASNAAVRDKLTELVAAIGVARSSAP